MSRGARKAEDDTSFYGRTKQLMLALPTKWPASLKLTTICLFLHAQDDGSSIYLSNGRMMEITGLTENTHAGNIAFLSKGGFLSDCGEHVHPNGARTRLRRLHIDRILADRNASENTPKNRGYIPPEETPPHGLGDTPRNWGSDGEKHTPKKDVTTPPKEVRNAPPRIGGQTESINQQEEPRDNPVVPLAPNPSRFDMGSDLLEPTHALVEIQPSEAPAVRQRHPAGTKPVRMRQPTFTPPAWVPAEAWAGWIEMRDRKKVPNTDRALRSAVKILDELAAKGWDPERVIDLATTNAWKSFYEPRDQSMRADTAKVVPIRAEQSQRGNAALWAAYENHQEQAGSAAAPRPSITIAGAKVTGPAAVLARVQETAK